MFTGLSSTSNILRRARAWFSAMNKSELKGLGKSLPVALLADEFGAVCLELLLLGELAVVLVVAIEACFMSASEEWLGDRTGDVLPLLTSSLGVILGLITSDGDFLLDCGPVISLNFSAVMTSSPELVPQWRVPPSELLGSSS